MSIIKCKECGSEISSKAKTCPKCGVEVASKSLGLGKVFGVVFLAIIAVSAFNSIFGVENHGDKVASQSEIKITPSSNSPPPVNVVNNSFWTYSEVKDEMRDDVNKFASSYSLNTVNFEYPYAGVQRGALLINDKNVFFKLEKGQITCNDGKKYKTCKILVKSNNAEAEYEEVEMKGDDPTVIRFTSPIFRIVLSHGGKFKIQPQVYKNGYPIFNFEVDEVNEKKL